ncbi:diphosphomevalonate decarboxylase [Plebeiibacterium sediminum]|uniref:diphosphomevalonate decarboxylase n=1 Tax=Plebeiibacterium sediminum TaxID=2992112 RepID=A0AAE3M8T9_9BACT|nr:diphosphomevalonate decarboxylase [Plebeiobacterium sediminum]MCW3788695.1 diphosphomevalonate decarboxylase [Plebeiobacterium sediminum]
MEYKQENGVVTKSSPANIAIVKYWGKRAVQLPLNPSISFSLKNCITTTKIKYTLNKELNDYSFNFLFENKSNSKFEEKLLQFFKRIDHFIPWLKHFHLNIESSNTFPHSSGIASSASSYSALAKALAEIHLQITGVTLPQTVVSEFARLGSGSACRSTQEGWNIWGDSSFEGSNDQYALEINPLVHESFMSIQDTVLIVSNQQKAISSTKGHQLMENHPYKEARIQQANKNTIQLIEALKNGDWDLFIEIAELEALSLHGLMMSSSPGYTLLLPNSLTIISKIREFRASSKIPVCFTIDAGPNIHVLYPESNKNEVLEFIERDLKKYCINNLLIKDSIA